MLRENILALVVLSALIAFFFQDILFFGKTYLSPDSETTRFLHESIASETLFPKWMPYIFSGMPATLIYEPSFVYLPNVVFQFLPAEWAHVLHYLLAGFGMFLLLRYWKLGSFAAIFGAVPFTFTTNLLAQEMFGHGGLMMTASYIPIVTYFTLRTLDDWKYGFALALVMGLQLQRGHVQIAYYTWMLSGFLYLWNWQRVSWRKVIVPSILALLVGAIKILPMFGYSAHSIRNDLSMDYATSWSLHPKEMLTFIWPDAFGFGGATYTGYLPFTDYPNFLGITVVLMAVVAMFDRRNRGRVVCFSAVVVVALFIAFGKYTPVYGVLFDYLPLFDRFRVPMMILILVQFSVAVLAAHGFQMSYRYLKRMNGEYFMIVLAILTVTELFWVGWLVAEPVPKDKRELKANRAVEFLKQDDGVFRILPLGDLFNRNEFAGHKIESVGGYHPAKLSIYQDFLDNPTEEKLNLLNVKYVVSSAQVKGVRSVSSGAWNVYNYGGYRQRYLLESGYVQILEKRNGYVKLNVIAARPGKLIISEVYHPNWEARVNGQEVEVLEHEDLICAVSVESESIVEFEYVDRLPVVGTVITMVGLVIVGLGISYTQQGK